MISTWTGAAAWRKVPQVVATGNSRLVTRKAIALTSTTGRSARSRACHGSARMPITDSGMPRKTRTLKTLWARPSTRISTSRAGPTAR